MLRLTKKVEYALIALRHIAGKENGEVSKTKEIAQRYHIPQELLAKILQQLNRAGIIRSVQGPRGGYVMARPLSEVSLARLIETVEGDYNFVECASGEKDDCLLFEDCVIRSPLLRINQEIRRFLNTVTVKQVVNGDVPPVRQGEEISAKVGSTS